MDIFEEKWSADVVTKWEPPEGFFKQSAEKIASGLKTASDDLKTAMGRLNFYINRAGKNLSDEDKGKLESAKRKLSKMYEDSAPRMSDILERIEESIYGNWRYNDEAISKIKSLVSKKPMYATNIDEKLKKDGIFKKGKTVNDRMLNSSFNQVMLYLRSGGKGLKVKAVKRSKGEYLDFGDYLILST
jgi:hypothetical protein